MSNKNVDSDPPNVIVSSPSTDTRRKLTQVRGTTLYFMVATSETERIYYNIPPRGRAERNARQCKDLLEKERLGRRREGFIRIDPSQSGTAMVQFPPGTQGFLDESNRFHTDTSGEEKRLRDTQIARKRASEERKRAQTIEREVDRWKRLDEFQAREEDKWRATRASGRRSRRNQSGEAYDPITLRYNDGADGQRLRETAARIQQRAFVSIQSQEKVCGPFYCKIFFPRTNQILTMPSFDLADVIDKSACYCLNEHPNHALENVFMGDESLYLSSDCDEELLLHIAFQQPVKLHSIHICGLPDATAPRVTKLYINRPNMAFSDVDDVEPTQTLELSQTNGPMELRVVKFQQTHWLTIYIESNHGDEQTIVTRLQLLGEQIAGTNMKELKKVEHE
ncbi:unnamed protein product [Albugo candida]|uniref:PITH domain-containing protein n=1 Tax=Albugo candida TaxID=65357 RepID=A0A024GU30_9STRA|nr:unnamed protein product [Albugo candida]|eukprot:CCI49860.1 unnamed protein product [Albugo candida]